MRLATFRDEYRLALYRREFGGQYMKVRIYSIFGRDAWSTIIATEEYPAWANIQRGALGYTEWKPSI